MNVRRKIAEWVYPDAFRSEVEYSTDFTRLYKKCQAYTMTSIERMFSLYQAVKYILDNRIKGDFVECGVWKGGSSMLIALMLKEYEEFERKIYLYDTFDGMSEPTFEDISCDGVDAKSQLSKENKNKSDSIWCYVPINEVRQNLLNTEINESQLVFVQGKVEETIPEIMPLSISLLRLDTDWYESTKHEMENLYPLLRSKGVLIVDDYGHWQGAKKAIDEYFQSVSIKPLLHRVDYTGRIMIKI